MAPDSSTRQYPLYNTTFTLHRVSPLYTKTNHPLTNDSLSQHAHRFRDILAGEVLRGVRVGLAPEDDVLARVGALQTVTWRLLPEEEAWTPEDETEIGNHDTDGLRISRGLILEIKYEKTIYRAIMLRGDPEAMDETIVGENRGDDRFQQFPLLLSKMPSSIREVFVGYLETNFDAVVSGLRLSRGYLMDVFEKYVADVSTGEDGEMMESGEGSRSIRKVLKDTVVFLGFDLPGGSASLKTIDISLAREDLPRMISKGKSTPGGVTSPFFNALAAYVKVHLALDLRHESVRVVRIACAAFVLGAEGKIKITMPLVEDDGNSPQSRATRRLMNGLVKTATIQGDISMKATT